MIKKTMYQIEELKREQEKLNQCIHRALSQPIAKNEEILEQSRKVDELITKIQGKKEK